MVEYLKSIVPELKSKHITYDIEPGEGKPSVGEYLVSIKKDLSPGTVYQVSAVRLVKNNKPRTFQRYHLTVFVSNDMLPFVKIFSNGRVFVKYMPAWGIIWHPRKPKK